MNLVYGLIYETKDGWIDIFIDVWIIDWFFDRWKNEKMYIWIDCVDGWLRLINECMYEGWINWWILYKWNVRITKLMRDLWIYIYEDWEFFDN